MMIRPLMIAFLALAWFGFYAIPEPGYAQEDVEMLKNIAGKLVTDITRDPDAQKLKGKRIVVAEFENKNYKDPALPGIFLEKLTTAFAKAKHFKVVERAQLEKAMKELKIGLTGLTDPGTRKELGRLVAASHLVVGAISETQGEVSFDARLVDIESGEIIVATDASTKPVIVSPPPPPGNGGKKDGNGPPPPPTPPPGQNEYTDPVTGMKFVRVKGGCFNMGDIFGTVGYSAMPIHEVCLDDFYLGKYEVTVGEFRKFVEETDYFTEAEKAGESGRWSNPRWAQSDRHPVVCVSYNDAGAFINWLNKKTGMRFRLPTEAEWEYAARSGGKRQEWAGTSNEAELDQYAWFNQNSEGKTHSVGGKKPNALGLYDMSGNVWEWVADWFDERYYQKSPKQNPQGPADGQYRVIRGGSWGSGPRDLRASLRGRSEPSDRGGYGGFRLALPLR